MGYIINKEPRISECFVELYDNVLPPMYCDNFIEQFEILNQDTGGEKKQFDVDSQRKDSWVQEGAVGLQRMDKAYDQEKRPRSKIYKQNGSEMSEEERKIFKDSVKATDEIPIDRMISYNIDTVINDGTWPSDKMGMAYKYFYRGLEQHFAEYVNKYKMINPTYMITDNPDEKESQTSKRKARKNVEII